MAGIKKGHWPISCPVSNMLFPITLLFLCSQIEGSPTFVEFVNSGLSVVGAKWVLPPSNESNQEGNESGTRQSNCRDCSRKVQATYYNSDVTDFFSGKICFWLIFNHDDNSTTPVLPLNRLLLALLVISTTGALVVVMVQDISHPSQPSIHPIPLVNLTVLNGSF